MVANAHCCGMKAFFCLWGWFWYTVYSVLFCVRISVNEIVKFNYTISICAQLDAYFDFCTKRVTQSLTSLSLTFRIFCYEVTNVFTLQQRKSTISYPLLFGSKGRWAQSRRLRWRRAAACRYNIFFRFSVFSYFGFPLCLRLLHLWVTQPFLPSGRSWALSRTFKSDHHPDRQLKNGSSSSRDACSSCCLRLCMHFTNVNTFSEEVRIKRPSYEKTSLSLTMTVATVRCGGTWTFTAYTCNIITRLMHEMSLYYLAWILRE